MPRIPLSTAQKIGHVDAEVNQQTAPGMGFGMDDARALQNAGDAIGQAGRGLGSALMQFGERVQEAEDRLAAAEYETEWNKRQKELETRMKENPGSVKEFGKWATESDAAWENDSKKYTDRMSKRYRDVFQEKWKQHRYNAVYRRQELTIQAQVKSLQDGYAKQIQDRINAGDYDGARDLVDGLKNMKGDPCSPFTEDQIQGFLEFVDKSETFGLLRKAFDSGDADQIQTALNLLKETDENGAYVRFTTAPEDESDEYWNVTGRGNLTEEERARWIKYGENVQMQQRNDAAKAYLAKVNSTGKYQTKKELDELLKAGEITAEDYNFRWKIAEGKEQEAEREKDKAFRDEMSEVIADYNRGGSIVDVRDELELKLERGIITPAQYNEGIRIIEILESKEEQKIAALQREQEAERAAQQRKVQEEYQKIKNKAEALKLSIQLSEYPPNHQQAAWVNSWRKEIRDTLGLYPELMLEVESVLDQRLKNDPLDKTEVGKAIKKDIFAFIKNLDQSKNEGVKVFSGAWELWNHFNYSNHSDYPDYSDAEMVTLQMQLISAARIFASEPGADYNSVQQKLQPYKEMISSHMIKSLFNPKTGRVLSLRALKNPGYSYGISAEATQGKRKIAVWKFDAGTPTDVSDDYYVSQESAGDYGEQDWLPVNGAVWQTGKKINH